VKLFGLEHSIPIFQPARIKTNDEVREVFEKIAPDACIVVAYGKILPEWLLAIPRLGCINVHASLLPKYRGAAPINWAIAKGETQTGVTIMQIDAGMDTGPMLARRVVDIGSEETAPELSSRLAKIGAELLSESLPRIAEGLTPVAQDDSQATYAPILTKREGLVDWTLSAIEIANRIRAFQPWPGSYTMLRDRRLIIWKAQATVFESNEARPPEPATIVGIDQGDIRVACANSTALRIEEMQVEGKRKLSARDLANGLRLSVGDLLTDRVVGG
jgi:methionyl-tRNA formyltransferase